MIDYPAFEAVFAIDQEGSFERAARRLGVTPSAISHRVRSLEERIGAIVLVRGSPCRATEAGRRICRHMERLRLIEADLAATDPAAVGGGGPRRATVRIVVNSDSLATWLMPALATIAGRPDRLLDIAIEDQDHARDWLERGETDAAVTASPKPAAACDVHPLGALRYRATASPDFVAAHFPGGVTREALAKAPCLVFNRKDALQDRWMDDRFAARLQPPSHRLPSTTGFVEASLSGIGWGLNPEPLVAGHLASGALVELVPGTPVDTDLYWQVSRSTAFLLEDLTRAIRAAARAALFQTT
ncbi:LysR family transcriptional regulator ArgP [Fulvimarina endophytica]|uniref:LysR family transcriptional regulator ArgP n=1 Tax=Fulvimarina endophytica TaxID=2293836 RepID=A0A371X3G4_9HYPH|nr:LysR family transcriptional regulator ArgP [Fulvimarina endophytica]RFC63770.1 LysR family transcriptional regulator ArgP [Fulvimarina endophytica]